MHANTLPRASAPCSGPPGGRLAAVALCGRRAGAHGQAAPDLGRREAGQELDGGARGVRAVQRIYDAVHVVQRQRVQDAVCRGPAPGADQRAHMRRQAAVRVQRAWRARAGPRRAWRGDLACVAGLSENIGWAG